MKNEAIQELIKSCDLLQQRTIPGAGFMYSSSKCFDACMRAFDKKVLPAQSITFKVFLNAPIMKEGRARFDRDGSLTMWIGTADNA